MMITPIFPFRTHPDLRTKSDPLAGPKYKFSDWNPERSDSKLLQFGKGSESFFHAVGSSSLRSELAFTRDS